MSNLKLITTEKFGEVDCNFYRNMNNDILLTREQIGDALEYANPQKAIQKIHLRHKDRLEPLCMRTKIQIGGNLTKVKNKNVFTIHKEELWKYADGHVSPKRINLWIGHGILLILIGMVN